MSKTARGIRMNDPNLFSSKRAGPRRKKAPTTKNLKRSIQKINRRIELKYNDYAYDFQHLTDASVPTYCLNNLLMGDTPTTRNGAMVSPTSIQIRFTLVHDVQDIGPSAVRMVVLWDEQPNGALPALGAVFDTTNAYRYPELPYNFLLSKRFKILWDKTVISSPLANAGVANVYISDEKFIKMKRKLSRVTKYSGNANTIADIQTNSLILMLMTDYAAAGTHGPNISFTYRMYYKDA